MSEKTSEIQHQSSAGDGVLKADLDRLEARVKSLEAEIFRADERIDGLELRLQLLSEQRR